MDYEMETYLITNFSQENDGREMQVETRLSTNQILFKNAESQRMCAG